MEIRRYKQGEEQTLWALLYDTVHKVNVRDYSSSQIEAWAPSRIDLAQWKRRIMKTNPFVAMNNGQIVGFAELEENGHIDCFYSAHNWQGKGVGSALLNAVEIEALRRGISNLFTEVSITAKGFFENKGFFVEYEKTVTLRGEQFANFAMSKRIGS